MLRRLRSKARRLRNCGWRLRQQQPLAAATAAEGRASSGRRDCGQRSRQRLPEAAPTEASGQCGGGGDCSQRPAAAARARGDCGQRPRRPKVAATSAGQKPRRRLEAIALHGASRSYVFPWSARRMIVRSGALAPRRCRAFCRRSQIWIGVSPLPCRLIISSRSPAVKCGAMASCVRKRATIGRGRRQVSVTVG